MTQQQTIYPSRNFTLGSRRFYVLFLLLTILLISTTTSYAQDESTTTNDESPVAEETTATEETETVTESEETTTEQTTTTEQATEEKPPPPAAASDDCVIDPKTDWGSYYDPKDAFCGDYDCYKILGLGDFDEFGKNPPTTKEITKKYRQLSRKCHPDKSKNKKRAKELFVKIVRAYEILTDQEKRKEYDFMRYNQDAYLSTYGSSVLWSYAPKSDASIIIIILLIVSNVFSWYAQKTRWQNVADRLVKAAVEDWSASQGGTPESKQLREEAMKILQDREKEQKEKEQAAKEKEQAAKSTTKTNGATKLSLKAKKEKKVSGKERKRQEAEALLPVIWELVNEMHDFGGGFHKPTWRDLMIVSLAQMPYKITKGISWQTKYYIRRFQKKELNDEEREILTQRAVGPVVWDTSTEEARQEMIKAELWITANLADWKEEQEIKNLSAWEQKAINKMRKKELRGKQA